MLRELYIALSANPASVAYFAPATLASPDVESMKKGASVVSPTNSRYLTNASGVAPKVCTMCGFPVTSDISSCIFIKPSALSLSKTPAFSSEIILCPP